MNKKLQVFVSSTYTDLIEERQATVQAILDAGHIPAGMELFKAGKSQMKTIRKWIDESDVYMLILGGRYGSIEEDSGLSYTELEYRYALSKNMPVFAVVLEDSFLFTKAASVGKDAVFEKKNLKMYDSFKSFVKQNIVKFPKNIDQITTIIHSQLNEILNDPEYFLTGWVKDVFGTPNTEGLFALDDFLCYLEPLNRMILSACFNTHRDIYSFSEELNMDVKKLEAIISGDINIDYNTFQLILKKLNLPKNEENIFNYLYQRHYKYFMT